MAAVSASFVMQEVKETTALPLNYAWCRGLEAEVLAFGTISSSNLAGDKFYVVGIMDQPNATIGHTFAWASARRSPSSTAPGASRLIGITYQCARAAALTSKTMIRWSSLWPLPLVHC